MSGIYPIGINIPLFVLSCVITLYCGPTWHETLNVWLGGLKEQGKKGVALGLYGLDGKHLCMIKSQQKAKLQAMLPSEYSQDLKDMDLTLLNWIILRNIMGIVIPGRGEEYLGYTRDEQGAISRVNSGEFHLAFLVNPVPVSGVLAVADAGNIMPPKSTYFYPKPPAGLVINPLWFDKLTMSGFERLILRKAQDERSAYTPLCN